MNRPTVLILGGRSDIGMACAHAFARQGHDVQLAARRAATLEADATDLRLRYRCNVTLHELDVLNTTSHAAFVDELPCLPSTVVSAIGLLGDQQQSELDQGQALLIMQSNYTGPALLLGRIANLMESRGSGMIIGISSVAGDRGRATNYIYGSAKAGFTAFLSGLRNRLANAGVHVLTVNPGFVATRMTAGMKLPPKLTATPEEVAQSILKAAQSRRNVIYVKPIWRLIMTVIGMIPESVFKEMKI